MAILDPEMTPEDYQYTLFLLQRFLAFQSFVRSITSFSHKVL